MKIFTKQISLLKTLYRPYFPKGKGDGLTFFYRLFFLSFVTIGLVGATGVGFVVGGFFVSTLGAS